MHPPFVSWAVSTVAHKAQQLYDHIVHYSGSRPVPPGGKKSSLVCWEDFWEEAVQAPELLAQRGCGGGGPGGERVLNNSQQWNN